MEKIKVLVIDDSALMRKLIMETLQKDEEIEVIATAMNGFFGLTKLKTFKPDIITLDIEMPQMNGLQFLQEKNKLGDETPVIVFSSLTSKGSETTMKALELGAKDFILKPSGSISSDISSAETEIIEKIKNWALKFKRVSSSLLLKDITKETNLHEQKQNLTDNILSTKINEIEKRIELIETNRLNILSNPEKIEFLAIGISTGGPEALRQILPKFKTKIPIIIVQHMPEGFTKDFAISLDRITKENNYKVKEIENDDILQNQVIYIAPGNHHISINTLHDKFILKTNQDPPVNNHRPSVDYFFASLLHNIEKNCFISIIMTGMGKDGAYYLKKLHDRGIFTIAQDENSSVVFGMPKVAIEMEGVDKILPLEKIPEFINNFKKD